MRDQLLALFAQGVERTDAIKIVGCSDDYISELLNDKSFTADLIEARKDKQQELIEEGYARLERKTINSLTKDVDNDFVDAAAKCRILESVAKNRVLHRNPSGHYTHPTAYLTIEVRAPQAADAQGIIIDQKTNQIIAIGDRNMAAMSIQGVQKVFREMEQNALQKRSDRATIDADLQKEQVNGDDNADQQVYPARAA